MKIKLTKKRNSISVQFRAQGGSEGVDLKEMVLSMAKGNDSVAGLVQELGDKGYRGGLTKETEDVKEFTVSKEGA